MKIAARLFGRNNIKLVCRLRLSGGWIANVCSKYFRGVENRYRKVSFLPGLDMSFLLKLTVGAVLVESILADVAAGDTLLEGWGERILPFDVAAIPPDLLENAPTFDDPQLDGIPLSNIAPPLRLPWLPLPPLNTYSGHA